MSLPKIKLLFILCIIIISSNIVLTFHNENSDISSDDVDIAEGKEIMFYGYKYTNTSNLIISSIQRNSCSWYPDNHPKSNLKTCEVIIEVINKNPVKLLNLTGQILSFLNENRITNYTISTEYSNYKDEFILNRSNDINNTGNKNSVNITRKKWTNFNKIKPVENINTDFSVKAEFDMPKYETEQFNITLDLKYQGNIIQLNLDPDVGECGTLSSAGTYTLNSSITATGTCITFGANGIILDGGGYTITGNSSGSGITTTGYNNVTIKNFGAINNFTYGVYLTNTNSSTVFNNTITSANLSGASASGIYLDTKSNLNNLSNNNITVHGRSNAFGIVLLASGNNDYNTIYGNTVNAQGSTANYAILVQNLADYNLVSSNTVTTSGGTGYGIYLQSGTNNNITYNNVRTTGASSQAIWLGTTNTNYVLNNNVTTTGSTSYGIYLQTATNNNISNNIINTTGAGGSNAFAMYLFSTSSRNNISANTITTSGNGGRGISLDTTNNDNIISNNIINTTGSSDSYAISLFTSNRNTISGNTITALGTNNFGFYIASTSNNNNITANTATTSGSSGHGVRLDAVSHNSFSNNNIKTTHATTAYGVFLNGAGTNNTFTNDNITATGVNDIRVVSNSATFTNVTFNTTDITFAAATSTGNVTVQWYLTTTVQNTSGSNLQNANVTIFNVSNIQVFNGLTASDGTIARQTLTEYWQNATNIYYETPHTINTTLTNYISNSTVINISATLSFNLVVQLTPLYTFFFKVLDDNGLEIDTANVTVTNATYTFASCLTNTTGQCTINDLLQNIAYNIVSIKTNYDNGINNSQTPSENGTTIGLLMVIQQGRITRNLTDCSGNAINNSFITIKYPNGTLQEVIKTNSTGFANSSLLSTNIAWDLFYNNYSDYEESDVTPPSTKVFHEACVTSTNTNNVAINNAKVRIYRSAIATETQTVESNTNSTGQINFILDNTQEPFNFYCDDTFGSIGANFSKNIPAKISCTVNTEIEDLLREINRTTRLTNSTSTFIKEAILSNFTSIQSYLFDINTTIYNNNYNISIALSMITNVNTTVLQTNSSIMNYLINTIVQAYLNNNTIGLSAIKNTVDDININSSVNVWSSILANGKTANLTLSNSAINITDVTDIIRTMMLGYKVDIQTPQFWYANNTISFLVTISDYIGRPVNPSTINANLYKDNLQDANSSLGNNISVNIRNVYIGFYHINITINSTPISGGYYLEINTTLNNTNSLTRQSFRITQSGPNRMAFILPDYCNTGENCNFQLDVTNEGNGDAEETFTCWFEDIYNGNNIVSQTSQQQLVKAQQNLQIAFSMPVPSYFKELNYYDIKCKYSIPNTEYQDMQPIESSLLIKAGVVTKTSNAQLWYYDKLGNLRFIPEDKLIEANYYKYLIYKRGQQRYVLGVIALPIMFLFVFRKYKINRKEKKKKNEKAV